MADLLSQAIVMEPEVMLNREHISLTSMTAPYRPDNSQRWESPSAMGPGTWLTPVISWVPPARMKAAVPNPSLREPSLTTVAVPFAIASQNDSPSSDRLRDDAAQAASGGRALSLASRVLGGGAGLAGIWSPIDRIEAIVAARLSSISALARVGVDGGCRQAVGLWKRRRLP